MTPESKEVLAMAKTVINHKDLDPIRSMEIHGKMEFPLSRMLNLLKDSSGLRIFQATSDTDGHCFYVSSLS